MAEFSGPFDGSPITTELQWSRIARRYGLDGVHAFDPAATTLKVTATGSNTVLVASGGAFANGFYYYNDNNKTLTVPANAGGAARVDLVVLRVDQAANKVSAEYKTGGTSQPTLAQDESGVWEIPLAQCTVAAGASVVTAANIVDRRYLTGRSVLPSIPGARPPAVKNQLMIESGKLYVGDGATWQWMATQGVDESTYTPVWTAGTTTINWSFGSTNIGRYQAVGRRVDLTIQLQIIGNPPAYEDPIQVSLPPGLPCTSAHRSLFTWNFTSANNEGSAVGVAMTFPTSEAGAGKIARLRYGTSDGNSVAGAPNSYNLLTNQPFNIRTGDVLTIDGSYWLA